MGGFKIKPVIITRPDGTEAEYESQSKASLTEPLEQSVISKLCRMGGMYKGFKARFRDAELPTQSAPDNVLPIGG